jgi:hypothetical protein
MIESPRHQPFVVQLVDPWFKPHVTEYVTAVKVWNVVVGRTIVLETYGVEER